MKPLVIKNKLCAQSINPPKYFVSVKSSKGTQLKLADPVITRSALALMCMQAVLGGAASHWGGPCAFVEIVSALYGLIFNIANQKKQVWHKLFHIINDAGHCENGIYAVRANYGLGLGFQDLKGFRSIHSQLTGHGEAHLFPEGVYLSNGPLGSTLAQAEGLCMADRLQGNIRTTCVLISDGACMEGETKEALASIAGLAQKNKMNPFIMIVSDNNTKLSGRIDKDSFSMNPTLQSLSVLGWQVFDLPQAHELTACVDQIEKALSITSTSFSRPVCIRAKTIKGYGVKATESAEHGGHGFPLKTSERLSDFLKEICGDNQLPVELINWQEELVKQSSTSVSRTVKRIKVQEGIGRALIRAGEKNWPVVSISADLQGSTGVLPFRKKFPDRSFEVGVAESNMISIAAGFSKQGFIPVVDTFTQFGVTKGALPLLMANLSNAPIIALFSHAGLQDAADGASHQSLTYLAQTASLPLTDIYCLTSAAESFALVFQAVKSFIIDYERNKIPRTKIFFFGREVFLPSYLPEDYMYQLDCAQVVFSHSSVSSGKKAISVVAAGPMLESAILAGKELAAQNWTVRIINPSIINHPDIKTIQSCLQDTKGRLLTVEDHYLIGGMGSLLSHALITRGLKVDIQSLAVRSIFGRSAYQSAHLYQQEKLTTKDIVECVLSKWS